MRQSKDQMKCLLCGNPIGRFANVGIDYKWCINPDYENSQEQTPRPVHTNCMEGYNRAADMCLSEDDFRI